MMLSIWNLLALVPPLLLIEGFFAGSEIALLSADKLTLKTKAQQNSKRAKLALDLANHPERVLSVTLLMTSLCVISISALITLFVVSRNIRNADLLVVALTSPLVVIIGELIPKTIYQRQATPLAPWLAYPVYITYWMFFPITRFLSAYTTRLSKFVGPIEEIITGKHRTTREELRAMLSYGKRESEIKPSERTMIRRIFDFKDAEAKHALIPLVQVDAVEDTATTREALEKFQQHQHSRMPVYSERIDNIVGVLELSDLFTINDLEQPIRNYVTPAHYVAESQALRELLLEMHREDNEMAVVVDEYGGAVGILTFEDIVEEIVGEINDEYDSEVSPYKELAPNSWLAQARIEIQQLNENLNIGLPEGSYETLGGFLLQQFGRIPEPGDELYFDTPEGLLTFTVRKANPRQIETVLIERSSPTSTG